MRRRKRRNFGEWFEWEAPPGGMFVWMRKRHPAIDTDALYRFALEEKVAFVPGSVFDPAAQLRSAMRVNFTRNAPAVLEEEWRGSPRRPSGIPTSTGTAERRVLSLR